MIFFTEKFLFAIDRRVQRWFKSCELAVNSRSQVNARCLQFNDVIDSVLNKFLHIVLPPTFTIVSGTAADSKTKGGGGKEGNRQKKGKSKDGNENTVKNTTQPEEVKLTTEELWKEHFANILPHNWPAWTEKI